jgi:excisionase family DNA binding protein
LNYNRNDSYKYQELENSMKTATHAITLSTLIDSLQRQLQDEPEQSEEWLSPQQIADELGMHINTIYRIIQSGQLPVYDLTVGRKGKTYYRIKRSDLEGWLEGRKR